MAGLTLTCNRPGPVQLAHAEASATSGSPRRPPRAAASAAVSGPAAQAQPACPPGSLSTFFDALRGLHDGSRNSHVRVLWLGDSHTNADFLSGTVRSALRERFGDGGPGFVRIGTKPYRHEGVKLSRDGKWNVDPDPPARRALQDNGVFGLGGTRAEPEAGASFSLQVNVGPGARDATEIPARFELSYALPPRSSFNLELAGNRQRVDVNTPADVASSGIAHLGLTAPLGSQLLVTPLRGAPQLFGVVIERCDAPGVVLDTSGIDGARLETPLAWDEVAFADEVRRRSPELLVVAYGTNEAFDGLKVERYGAQLAKLVERVRRGAPRVSCLVLGPTDAPLGGGSVPRVAEVAAVLQKSSSSLGCSFASLQRLMGGEGSFARGMMAKERLAQPDKLHLTPKGYQELGRSLSKLILEAYLAGGAALP